MSNIEKLRALRKKLVARRRIVTESSQTTPAEQLTGDTLAKIQNAIDAVDRAIADENAIEASGSEAVDRAIADEKAAGLVRPIKPSPRP